MTVPQVPPRETLRKMRQHIRYDRSGGRLFWRDRPPEHFNTKDQYKYWKSKKANQEAFATAWPNGDIGGNFEGRRYLNCQVCFFFENGFWPEF